MICCGWVIPTARSSLISFWLTRALTVSACTWYSGLPGSGNPGGAVGAGWLAAADPAGTCGAVGTGGAWLPGGAGAVVAGATPAAGWSRRIAGCAGGIRLGPGTIAGPLGVVGAGAGGGTAGGAHPSLPISVPVKPDVCSE